MKRNQEHRLLRCEQPDLGDLFLFYVNGSATPDQCRQIEEHVSQCQACQEELEFFLTLREAVTRDERPVRRARAAGS